uniref:Uncharacterized protein n=1 Tax=Anopheles dirus TaxID=7168 RepID=A0A182NVP9_9DIPT
MNKVDVIDNPKLVKVAAMIRRYGPTMKYFVVDFQAELLQTLTDATVSTLYYVPNRMGKYDKAIYNRTMNFCTFLRQPATDRILKMIYENMNRAGNLPKRCPIMVGKYSFNTSLDGLHLPSFLPESNFRFDLKFHRGPRYELILVGHWYGELKRVS